MPSTPMSPRGVSLDLWMTLIKSDPRFKPTRNAMLRDTFAPEITKERFSAVLREADKEADAACMGSGRDLGLSERLAMTLERLRLPVDERMKPEAVMEAQAEQSRLARAFHPLPMTKDLPGLLRVLRREAGSVVVSTSNTGMLPANLMRELLDLAGFKECFDAQVFSDEVQAASLHGEYGCKPYPSIFTTTFEAMKNLRPTLRHRDVVHIGDNYVADYCGSAGFGLRPVLVNVPGVSTTADVLRKMVEE